MAYTALYRTWRPLSFDDVVGQKHITNTLKNEISSGRVGHAYLFCGTRGTGKTSTARILSRAINCLSPKDGNPCNVCENCRGILEGKILDIAEIDAASNNGVDSIRDLREEARFEGTRLKNRIYIIDEVHMLSQSAFNALLKILEEPPEHVRFILATTEAHKVPETILSRCQRFDFRRITTQDIEGQLRKILMADGYAAEDRAIRLMAEKADGSMRDALSILDQCMAVGDNTLTYDAIAEFIGATDSEILYKLADAIATENPEEALLTLRAYAEEGKPFLRLGEDFVRFLRNLLLCQYLQNPQNALDVTEETAEELSALSKRFSREHLLFVMENAVRMTSEMRFSVNPRYIFEIELIKMIHPILGEGDGAIAARIGQIENMLKNGVAVVREKTERKTESVKKEEKAPEKKKEAVKADKMADAFEKNRAAILDRLLKENCLQIVIALENVSRAEERNGRLCLLFKSEEEMTANRGLLLNNMEILRDVLREKAGIEAEIELDKEKNTAEGLKDPLETLENF